MRWLIPILILGSMAMAQTKELKILGWEDYFDPAVIQRFEREFKVKIIQNIFDSNEQMLTTMQRGGTARFDIVVPSDFVVPQMIRAGMLMPLDKAKLPNFKNLEARFANPPYDRGGRYTAGYMWGTVGLMYDSSVYKTPPQSWSVLFDPKQQRGSFFMMNSQREMLGVALRFIKQSVNSCDTQHLWSAMDVLLDAQDSRFFLGFQGGTEAAVLVEAKKATAAVVYNQDALKHMDANPNLRYTIPQEGSTLFVDSLAIASKAPSPDLAHQFINFVLEAKVGAQLAEYNYSATPNAAAKALIEPEFLQNPAIWPTEAQSKSLEFILNVPNPNMYNQAWIQIKGSR
jgi:spermidine/putrescine transport system substrate-binding protein